MDMELMINISLFTNILSMCKGLHWATSSYAKHMALDQAYDDFNEVFDKYVEVAIGIYGRDSLYTTSIINELCSDESIYLKVSDEFLKCNKELEKINGNHSSLISLYDEIRAIQNQLLYRLTFND